MSFYPPCPRPPGSSPIADTSARAAGIAVPQRLFRVMLSLVVKGKATRRRAAKRVKPHCLGGPRHLSRAECVAMNAQKS
jgi:hypothetical protein